jgi:integrase
MEAKGLELDRIRYITVEEYKRFLDVVKKKSKRFYYAFLICGNLGLRVRELVSLKYGDFDLVKNTVTIKTLKQKGKDIYDTIEFDPSLGGILKKFFNNHKPDELIFDLSVRQMQRMFDKYARDCDLKIKGTGNRKGRGIHCLRHLKGLMIAQQTKDPYVIAKLMRHRNISTSLSYIHLLDIKKTVQNIGIIK